MKLRLLTLGILMCLVTVPSLSRAQEQAKKPNDDQVTHLRVDIRLTEVTPSNGKSKDIIGSFPYTLYVASKPRAFNLQGSLRLGVRVPVATGSNSSDYMNVGTDIDCRATTLDDGGYDLNITVNRSSIYTAAQGDTENQQIRALPDRPIIRNFNTQFDVALRDGETKQGTSATDPLNGHVLNITVSLTVEK